MPAELLEVVETPAFAHESEAEVARLLDFYEVQWHYEPHTFLLEADEEGNIREQFRPDFFLPDYGMYLEITTVKPALRNRKNRKIRRFRERYPDLPIKLLTYKDVEALLVRKMGSSPAHT